MSIFAGLRPNNKPLDLASIKSGATMFSSRNASLRDGAAKGVTSPELNGQKQPGLETIYIGP
jgi:hypothetical protein